LLDDACVPCPNHSVKPCWRPSVDKATENSREHAGLQAAVSGRR
jgi:hypothetical protein